MDDFTFPTIRAGRQCKEFQAGFPRQLSLSLGSLSPPPWFTTAIVAAGCGSEEEEDKMDMLWEDFNEELASVPPLCPLSPLIDKRGPPAMMRKEAWLHDDVVVAGNAEKRIGHLLTVHDGKVVRRRRWSLLLMLKLLKKLFLVKRASPGTAPI